MKQKQFKGDKTLLTWILCRQTTLDIFTNRSQHLFNFIPGELSYSHRRLCKYRRSNSPTDSPAWQLSLTTNLCFFQINCGSSASVKVVVEPQLGRRFWEHRCLCTLLCGGQCRCWKDLCHWTSSISVPEHFVWIEKQKKDGFWQTDSLCEKKGANLIVTLFECLPRAAWGT